MKKRLITILSLVMAVVLCFSLAACGGDKGDSKGKNPQQSGKAVTVSLSDALDVVDGVLNAEGFTGTASYTLSTKNTQAITDTVTLDKRGSKLKVASDANETIIDFQTGYVYYKYNDVYAYDTDFYANSYNYAKYLIAALKEQAPDQKYDARYDAKAKTVTFTVEKADSINKYLAPLQNAYADEDAQVGNLLDDYCMMFFGKTFDAMYGVFEEYIKDSKHTVGTLLDLLKTKGVDVEAILASMGMELPEETMTAVRARPLNKVVAGAYNFVMANFKDWMPSAIDETEDGTDDDQSGAEGGGMQPVAIGLMNALLFDPIADEDIAESQKGLAKALAFVKNFYVNAVVDMALKNNAETADLYTVIKDGVKLKNMTMTLTLTVGDNKTIKGIKLDGYIAHTYTGTASEDSFLADNDYHATAQLNISAYTTPTDDFEIELNVEHDYKKPIVSLIYEVTDKDVSVYYETADYTPYIGGIMLCVQTPGGEITDIYDAPDGAVEFDEDTSSFVFDGTFVKSVLGDAEFGTSLYAIVFFDDDDNGYAITLTYVNDDLSEIYNFAYQMAMDKILGFIGGAGADAPNVSDKEVA